MYEQIIYSIIDNDLVSYREIGAGASRTTFRLPDGYVVKISQTTKDDSVFCDSDCTDGYMQSKHEIDVYTTCPEDLRYLLNPIVEYSSYKGYTYIIQKEVIILDDYEDLVDICDDLNYDYDMLYYDIEKLCNNYSLNINDFLYNTSNIGLDENQIIFVDYGYGILYYLFS